MESIFCQDNHISDTALLDNLIHFLLMILLYLLDLDISHTDIF